MKQSNAPFYQKNFQLPATPGGTIQPTKQAPWIFGFNQKIQTNRGKFSVINIQNAAMLSNNAVNYGTFANGSVLFLSTTLTPQSPHGTEINLAVPYVAIYQGSFVNSFDPNFQIFPTIGGSVTPFSYSVQGNTDWHLYNGTTSAWGGAILNNTGATGTISFVTQWKYLNINSGTVV